MAGALFLWLQGLPHHTTTVLWWRGSSWLSLRLSRSFWWNAQHGKAAPCYFLFIREEIHVLCQKYEEAVISKKIKMKRCALWKSGSIWKFSTPCWAHLEGGANPLGFTCIFLNNISSFLLHGRESSQGLCFTSCKYTWMQHVPARTALPWKGISGHQTPSNSVPLAFSSHEPYFCFHHGVLPSVTKWSMHRFILLWSLLKTGLSLCHEWSVTSLHPLFSSSSLLCLSVP